VTRDELVEAVCRVVHPGAESGGLRRTCPTGAAVLDAVEPLIRADERSKVHVTSTGLSGRIDYAQVRSEVLANLRDKVEALRVEAGKGEAASAAANYTQAAQEYAVERAAYESVLTLFDGEDR
jgi:hypothetical protein